MRTIVRITLVALAVLGFGAMLPPTHAICQNNRPIQSNSYVFTDGCLYGGCGSLNTSVTDNFAGAFWALGYGDPGLALGIDNGGFPSVDWFYIYPGSPALLSTSWSADDGIDGCIDDTYEGDPCMVMHLEDIDPTTGDGVFALLSTRHEPPGVYDFTQASEIVLAVAIPSTVESMSTGICTGTAPLDCTLQADCPIEEKCVLEVTTGGIARDDIEAGLYLDPTCPFDSGGMGLSDVIRGYQILWQPVSRGSTQPPNLDVATWTPTGPVVPLGDPSTFSLECTTGEEDYYLATVLAYDSNYRDRYVSVMSTRVQCGAPDMDNDGFAGASDCDDTNDQVWADAGEVLGVTVMGPPTTIAWDSQDATSGPGTSYDVVSGDLRDLRVNSGFVGATCLAADHADTPFADMGGDPVTGDGFYYLVRARNTCATATYGESAPASGPRDDLDSSGPCP